MWCLYSSIGPHAPAATLLPTHVPRCFDVAQTQRSDAELARIRLVSNCSDAGEETGLIHALRPDEGDFQLRARGSTSMQLKETSHDTSTVVHGTQLLRSIGAFLAGS